MLNKNSIRGKTAKTRDAQENLLCLSKAHRIVMTRFIKDVPKSNNCKTDSNPDEKHFSILQPKLREKWIFLTKVQEGEGPDRCKEPSTAMPTHVPRALAPHDVAGVQIRLILRTLRKSHLMFLHDSGSGPLWWKGTWFTSSHPMFH